VRVDEALLPGEGLAGADDLALGHGRETTARRFGEMMLVVGT